MTNKPNETMENRLKDRTIEELEASIEELNASIAEGEARIAKYEEMEAELEAGHKKILNLIPRIDKIIEAGY